jgi:hypothetical protein
MTPNTKRRIFFREAIVSLALATLAVRFLSARLIFAWAGRHPKRVNRFAGSEIIWVSWAIETVGTKWWMTAPPLSRALAAQSMLRRRGVESRLCLGVAHEGDELVSRAWIDVGERDRRSKDLTDGFTKLVEFGGDAPGGCRHTG